MTYYDRIPSSNRANMPKESVADIQIMNINKNKLLLLLLAGTTQYDRKYNKTSSMHILNVAWDLPKDLFDEPNYDEMSYAIDILEFEYGILVATGEEYTSWINKYFKWKSHKRKLSKKKV